MAEYIPDNQVAANTATPASGSTSVAVDSVTKRLRTKDDAAAIVDYIGISEAEQGASRLQNKDLDAATTKIVDGTDTTKKIGWQASGASTTTTLTIAEAQTTSQTLNVPNLTASSIIITDTLAQTVTGAKTMSGANIITHSNAGLLVQNPAATFTVQVTPSAEVASRVLTIPLLGAADTIDTLGLAQSITGVKTMTNMTTLAGTATVPSMTITPAGTVMTTPTAGVVEADAAAFYKTIDTTEGRCLDDRYRFFKLAANGSGITTIADFFGTNDGIGFVTNAVLEIEWHCYFTVSVAATGNMTWTIVNTQTTTNMVANWMGSAIAGIGATGTISGAGVITQTAASVALPATGTLAIASHYYVVRAFIEAATAGNVRLRATMNVGGTATPLRDSYFKVRRMPALNAGTFVA